MSESTDQTTASSERSIVHDALVVASLGFLVFGSLLSKSTLIDFTKDRRVTTDFTSVSVSQSGDQLSQSWGSLMSDFLFELGWTGDSSIVASALDSFVGFRVSNAFKSETTHSAPIAQVQSLAPTQQAVLGLTTEQSEDNVTDFTHPNLSDEELVSLPYETITTLPQPEVAQTQGRFVGIVEGESLLRLPYVRYETVPGIVSKVEFYLNGTLIAIDSDADFALPKMPLSGVTHLGEVNQLRVKAYFAVNTSSYIEDVVTFYGPR